MTKLFCRACGGQLVYLHTDVVEDEDGVGKLADVWECEDCGERYEVTDEMYSWMDSNIDD